ncbi:uncharacterized protein NMK_1545, partial [Novimethylophilus kurashikiensis]
MSSYISDWNGSFTDLTISNTVSTFKDDFNSAANWLNSQSLDKSSLAFTSPTSVSGRLLGDPGSTVVMGGISVNVSARTFTFTSFQVAGSDGWGVSLNGNVAVNADTAASSGSVTHYGAVTSAGHTVDLYGSAAVSGDFDIPNFSINKIAYHTENGDFLLKGSLIYHDATDSITGNLTSFQFTQNGHTYQLSNFSITYQQFESYGNFNSLIAGVMAGNDSMSGASGNDVLAGFAGNDNLKGLTGNDNLFGGDGNDVLDGGAGTDVMYGGAGADVYVVDNVGDVVDESPHSPFTQPSGIVMVSSNADAGGEHGSYLYGTARDNALSVDGQFAVFTSSADYLDIGGTNAADDIFLKDIHTGSLIEVSTSATGELGNSASLSAVISGDERYVLFTSFANNLVIGDTNAAYDVFRKDLQTGAIERVSTDATGAQASGSSMEASFSSDDRYVIFTSNATNLVAGDHNSSSDIFTKDLLDGSIQRVSTDSSGNEANGNSSDASFSANGQYVVFTSDANNLVNDDTNAGAEVFVKNLDTGVVQRVALDSNGVEAIGYKLTYVITSPTSTTYSYTTLDPQSTNASISADGRYVAFQSTATNLVEGTDTYTTKIFVKDLQTGAIQLASSDVAGVSANDSSENASISADGKYVVFDSRADNLVANDTNGESDVFIKNLQTGEIQRLSLSTTGEQGLFDSNNASFSADGHYVIFHTLDSELVGVSGNSGTGDVVRVENPFNPPPEPTTPDDGAIDTVLASITYSLGANVEDLTLTGSASISGTGNELDNVLTGNAAANTLTGNEGNDTLNGGVGADTLIGGLGDDIYVVDNVLDVVTENANEGTDTVNASVGYSLAANIENLTLSGLNTINGTGNELDNVLTGNDAANILDGGLGADTLIGGKGGDTYVVDNANDVVTESLIAAQGGGIDLVKASITYVLGDNLDNLTLTGTDDIDGTGNSLNNTIIGNDGANALYGAGGIDILKGGKGDDTYTVDLIKVGTGTTAIAALQDSVTENLNEGTDTVILTGSVTDLTNATTLTLGANLDNLDASGTGTTKLNLTGNLLANELTGNDANNVLDGGLGADTLIGGLGNDTYVVDNVGDTITENTDEGTELVKVNIATANGTYTLEANVDNATLINAVAYNLTGNTLDNVLTGNGLANTLTGDEGADTLNGGAGADSMIGGLGDDVYVVDNTLDTVTENADEGTDTVRSSVSFNLATQGANVENLTLIGAALNG